MKYKTSFLCIVLLSLLVGISSPQSVLASPTFVFRGTGVVQDFTDIGVPGETLTFEFMYSLSDFADNSFPANVADYIGSYQAITPIPILVVGSQSGIINVDPVRRVTVIDDLSNGDDAWQFSTGSKTDLFVTWWTYNDAADVFSRPLPDSFADAHGLFYPNNNDPNVWERRPGSTGIRDGQDTLYFTDAEWEVVAVPEASTSTVFMIYMTGLLGLVYFKRRSKR